MAVAAVAAATLIPEVPAGGGPPPKGITLTPLGVYRSNHFDAGGAEIVAYDALTRRLFVVNLADVRIDVLDISDPATPFLTHTLDVSPFGSQANSVAAHEGLVAIAVQAEEKTDAGVVVFFDAFGALLAAVPVGALPDMLTFTPNGRYVLVANEGEPNDDYTIDPPGTVSVIAVRGPGALTAAGVTTLGFDAFDAAGLDPSIRIYGPNASVAQDLEPEYIAVSHDSRTAWVTLQENNALAILDLAAMQVVDLVGLGFKNHALPGDGLDASDRDGVNQIQPWPVWGMFQPDAIAAFRQGGRTYLLTANEGDVREYDALPDGEEAARVGSLTLDPTAFPGAGALQAESALGRLNVTLFNGDDDGDGDFDRLFAFGGRSFSVWTDSGAPVFDSGDALERLTADRHQANFNASNTNNTRDNRSDDKGPEPEAITVARLFGRQYAFIGLERIGGIVVYELTDPAAPRFVDYVNVRSFVDAPGSVAAGDLGPEGVIVIPAESSPTGEPLLAIANEVSGTMRLFAIRAKD
jgi:hypothetical protein